MTRIWQLLLAIVCALAVVVQATDDKLPKLQIGIRKKVPAEKCTRKAKSGDNVKVHYTGKLEDGTVFDTSYKRGQPLEFPLGVGRVIQGWDQGVKGMCIGEKRKLTIPPHLGYGEQGIGPIPGGATLIFETELVGIDDEEIEPENVEVEEEDDEKDL